MNLKIMTAALTLLAVTSSSLHAEGLPEFNKENVGKGLGAITGAIIGSKIGGGSGRAAAIAAGALAGYWLGGQIGAKLTELDRQGIEQATTQAISTGQTTTWRNPDTGTSTQVSVSDYTPTKNMGLKPALNRLPPIEQINAYYAPKVNINVRGGPGTNYTVLHQIKKGEPVPVVGRVVDSNWYLVAEQGRATGFVYAPLMVYDSARAPATNAIRDASSQPQPGRYLAATQKCRLITQRVNLADGEEETHQFKACQQADGSWTRI